MFQLMLRTGSTHKGLQFLVSMPEGLPQLGSRVDADLPGLLSLDLLRSQGMSSSRSERLVPLQPSFFHS